MSDSLLEQAFFTLWTINSHCRAHRPGFVREYAVLDGRRLRFDFAWPDHKVAVEIQGGTSIVGQSRHTRPHGYQRDCEKLRLGQLAGWIVLPYTAADLRQRPVQVIEEVERALEFRGNRQKAKSEE